MSVLLGLAVAAAYGSADFLGGLSARRTPALTVVLLSQASSVVLVALLLAADGAGPPEAHDLVLGGAAGAVGCVGLLLLYRGLAVGRMAVVAPITAAAGGIVPFTWAVATGERPAAVAVTGVGLALVGVVLIARAGSADHRAVDPRGARRELALSLAAGTCFGTVFILLGSTSADAGFWPLAAARPVSVALLAAVAIGTRRTMRAEPADTATIVGAGALDMAANAIYLLAVRRGLLSLVAVLSSLYPAATVVLAWFVLHERISRVQGAGLFLAGAGVALIAAG